MKTHLSVIFSLITLCGQLPADSVSSNYDYDYGKFLENSKGLHQEAISVLEQLLPHEEKQQWTISHEYRSWSRIGCEWASSESSNRRSWISMTCVHFPFEGVHLSSYCSCVDYIDDEGFSHVFTIINEYQAIEETIKDNNSIKSITFITKTPTMFFTIEYTTYQDLLSFIPTDEVFIWEITRDCWISRFLSLQMPERNFSDETDDIECK